MKPGDRVRIVDGSEAHGDTGAVWVMQDNGLVLVNLDGTDTLWPVETTEIALLEPTTCGKRET